MKMLKFPTLSFPLSAAEACEVANQQDVETLHTAILQSSQFDPIVSTIVQHSILNNWSRELTVMFTAYTLLLKSHELQGHIMELLGDQPMMPPGVVVPMPSQMEIH